MSIPLRRMLPSHHQPLFILPPAVVWAGAMQGLSHLPVQQGVYAVQAEAFSDPQAGFASSLQELAEGYLKLIEKTLAEPSLPRRFALMGWSGRYRPRCSGGSGAGCGAQVERVILLMRILRNSGGCTLRRI